MYSLDNEFFFESGKIEQFKIKLICGKEISNIRDIITGNELFKDIYIYNEQKQRDI